MMRLAALVLLAILAALPLAVRPSTPPVAWLATVALVVGAAGVIAWSVPLAVFLLAPRRLPQIPERGLTPWRTFRPSA